MKTELFFINAISNLHVGSGEVNYGLIDNLIQRDPVTGLPTINSSSLKGAIREHFENISPNPKVDVRRIFGSKPDDNADNRNPGKVRFFEADLVALPVRCADADFPYVMISAKEHLSRLCRRLEMFNINAQFLNIICDLHKKDSVTIEDLPDNTPYATTTDELEPYLDKHIAIVDEPTMGRLCNDEHLPVISRNCLDDGRSTNLFYEQVLPRYSRLCTVLMSNDNTFETFCEELDKQIVQIGGNATIGYGYCQFTRFPNTNPNKQ